MGKRRKDIRKMNDLAQSLNPNKPIPGIEKCHLKEFPAEQTECMFGEAYTYLDGPSKKWYDLYNLIEEAVTDKGKGKAQWDEKKEILHCEMNVARQNHAKKDANEEKEVQSIVQDTVAFDVEIFLSRAWKGRHLELPLMAKEIEAKNEHQVFVVKITRVLGDPLVFTKLKNGFLLTYCSSIIKGLPGWAVKMEQKLQKEEAKNQKAEPEQNKADDYYKQVKSGDLGTSFKF